MVQVEIKQAGIACKVCFSSLLSHLDCNWIEEALWFPCVKMKMAAHLLSYNCRKRMSIPVLYTQSIIVLFHLGEARNWHTMRCGQTIGYLLSYSKERESPENRPLPGWGSDSDVFYFCVDRQATSCFVRISGFVLFYKYQTDSVENHIQDNKKTNLELLTSSLKFSYRQPLCPPSICHWGGW